jgi:serine-type D-Ala-D-Ala carboxypeptidase/endopeptidase (penicillin-binding protein 4)
MNLKTVFHTAAIICALLSSCSITGQIQKDAEKLLSDSLFVSPHVGIAVFEPSTGKFLYNYQSQKYFIPASNTKIFTLYAGLKYLKDSIPAAALVAINDSVYVQPAGDPTFLHPEFKYQPLFDVLKQKSVVRIVTSAWQTRALGYGWAWDDYNEEYMAERSIMPVYGNVISAERRGDSVRFLPYQFATRLSNEFVSRADTLKLPTAFTVSREWSSNVFEIVQSSSAFRKTTIPYRTDLHTIVQLLTDTLKSDVGIATNNTRHLLSSMKQFIASQPSDTLFRIMMHRSDNFFAEQILLMAANQKLGVFKEAKIIDTLLKSELKELPQRPKWVDGSGLSRYNLFTPEAFVYVLNKMEREFGFERIKHLFPTGGQGTLRSYYNKDSGYVFAKTGTLSNHLALSGYLITKQNKRLIFSILVNSYPGGATPIRRKIESFLTTLRNNY